MTRLLGIDLGERRIGLAIAETGRDPAQPLSTLKRSAAVDRDAAALAELIASHAIDELVVGLPLDVSGDEGGQGADECSVHGRERRRLSARAGNLGEPCSPRPAPSVPACAGS